jgi:hypothetical protein
MNGPLEALLFELATEVAVEAELAVAMGVLALLEPASSGVEREVSLGCELGLVVVLVLVLALPPPSTADEAVLPPQAATSASPERVRFWAHDPELLCIR